MMKEMCPCYTAAKIRKASDERVAVNRGEKISFAIPAPRLFLPKFFPDGNAKKKQRIVHDFIFGVCCCFDSCNCHTLALAYAHSALCVYVFCIGDGDYITATAGYWIF